MRTYYIFKMKKEFHNLYMNNETSLYNILRHLYYMNKCDVRYGFNLFKQLTEPVNKEKLDREIFIKLHQDMTYTRNKKEHIINNLYKDEISVLTIKKAYILLNVNKDYSEFFKIIENTNSNYFICDFKNQDYFWISKIKLLSNN